MEFCELSQSEKYINKLHYEIEDDLTDIEDEIKLSNEENESIMELSTNEIDETPKPKTKQQKCEDMLYSMAGFMDMDFYKKLKKRMPTFKKEIYKTLTKEDKQLIILFDTFTQKLINQAIKANIEEIKQYEAED